MQTSSAPVLQGAALIVAGMVLIGLIDNFVVEIARLTGLWQFHASRAAIALPMLVAIGFALGWSVRPNVSGRYGAERVHGWGYALLL